MDMAFFLCEHSVLSTIGMFIFVSDNAHHDHCLRRGMMYNYVHASLSMHCHAAQAHVFALVLYM